jgi:hypothetical protein
LYEYDVPDTNPVAVQDVVAVLVRPVHPVGLPVPPVTNKTSHDTKIHPFILLGVQVINILLIPGGVNFATTPVTVSDFTAVLTATLVADTAESMEEMVHRLRTLKL